MKKNILRMMLLLQCFFCIIFPLSVQAETYGDLTYKVNSDKTITITACNQSVTDVTIPSEIDGLPVTIIGSNAFAFCSNLTNIIIPNSVKTIDSLAFNSCTSLTDIVISESVTSIGAYTFQNCTGLTSVTIPKSVTSIGYYAFDSCKNLTNITLSEGITDIDAYTFSKCSSLTNITIPEGVISIGNAAFYGCSSLSNVIIPKSVTTIGNGAFRNCSSLTGITIPEGVTVIGMEAFRDCTGLTNITIPESTMSIGKEAFAYCSSLTSIIIPNNITRINDGLFYECSSLTKVAIGKNVTYIGAYAFGYCKALTTVTIPRSLKKINDGVFADCRAIKTIEYEGSNAEWAKMFRGINNGSIATATVICGYLYPVTVSYDANGGIGAFDMQKVDVNSSIMIPEAEPTRDGYAFLGWSTVSNAATAEYKPGDTMTVGEENVVLYAVWKKIVCTNTQILNGIFLVTPTGVSENNSIVFTCYKDGKLVYSDVYSYNGEASVPFVPNTEYDEVKVMVWESLKTILPLCGVESVSV